MTSRPPGPVSQHAVLVLNCGSSSVKFALVEPVTGQRRMSGLAERVGTPDASVETTCDGETARAVPAEGTHRGVLAHVLGRLRDLPDVDVTGVGHRVVHGGEQFRRSALVDQQVLDAIRAVSHLAPLHNPANLVGIEAARAELPDLAHVAVFDTAFHQTMPPPAFRYAVPGSWYGEHGVRRYGFHGTSHRYVSGRAAELLGRPLGALRLVTAHLGNGCSAAAVRDGISVDTTMGLTPLEGLVMGTRSGDVDPGILGYIADRLGLDVHDVLQLLNTESGLRGLSGISNDVREISEAAARGSPSARLALDVFSYRAAKHVAALVVPLERLDALVFTGGIGENSAAVRTSILRRLGFLGLSEDEAANAAHGRFTAGRITHEGPVQALVVPTDEELVIARDTAAVVSATGDAGAGVSH